MPTPLGHMLAGVAVAWGADLVPGDRAWRAASSDASWYRRAGNGLTLACGALGALADLDLLVLRTHRTFTHSMAAVAFIALFAAAMAANAHRPILRVAVMCAAAYASHLLLDWLGIDNFAPRGIQAWWPFSHAWYISGRDLFWETARNGVFERAALRLNAIAVAREIEILLPVLVLLWTARRRQMALLSRRDNGDELPFSGPSRAQRGERTE
jgi:membrane-bound metal-dependent hydrolase YbcI (DUF457 family)